MTPRVLRLRYFVWLIVPIGILAGHLHYGAPHLAFSYTYVKTGYGRDTHDKRIYLRCIYIGPYGTFYAKPDHRGCGRIRFFKRSELG